MLDDLLPWLCIAPVALIVGAVFIATVYTACRRATNRNPGHWLRVRRGKGLGIPELARRLGMTVEELDVVDVTYHTRWIEKRGGGSRRLDVPGPELKRVQKRILRMLIAKLNTHSAVTGFEPGCSIVDNATPHVSQAVVINIDVRDFFTETHAGRLQAYFQRVGWNREAAVLLTRLTTHDGGLPQGAPTSPRLSNLVNYGLDARIDSFARTRRATYTRYADDITISFPRDYPKKVRGMVQAVRRQLKAHGYQMHGDKLRIRRQHQQQKVTGLVVNERVNLPRQIRRKLRAVEHHHKTNRPATLTPEQLAGWRALQQMIEKQA
jgi:hypothetical protein